MLGGISLAQMVRRCGRVLRGLRRLRLGVRGLAPFGLGHDQRRVVLRHGLLDALGLGLDGVVALPGVQVGSALHAELLAGF